MDEAENCGRIAVMDHGRIVAMDTPDGLKNAVGGDLVTFSTADAQAAAQFVREQYHVEPQIQDGQVRFHVTSGETFMPDLVREFTQRLLSTGLHRPTHEDVFTSLPGT